MKPLCPSVISTQRKAQQGVGARRGKLEVTQKEAGPLQSDRTWGEGRRIWSSLVVGRTATSGVSVDS